ncbi:DUF2157 domain-containing protein [Arundinibacter roseus]|uniref:DUF2157 domain-containing protein n=1 Tax=Arundinibacter roseus TaxID=2070510 RepID=A0A4R4KEA1_9BACT|nr:DUF2157 domain-containing protein [Arundinibacter roseus]TDB65122.1 DUF2157 domain-containing protein [Arundinibacter roseus]
MKTRTVIQELLEKNLLSEPQAEQLQAYESQKPVSLYYLLHILLYASVSAFIAGIGVLIYQNIDSIGHSVLIGALCLLMLACFGYVFQKSAPFQWQAFTDRQPILEGILLLGCLLFLAIEGYVQYQYQLFGERYGVAVLIPALLFFFLSYRFDHQGVLSLSLTAFASWAGLTAAPSQLLVSNDFSDPVIIHAGLAVGVFFVALGVFLARKGIKPHFMYTYLLIAGTLFLASASGGLFTIDSWQLLYAALIAGGCWYFYTYARTHGSLLFLLLSVVFGYTAFTYLLFHNISMDAGFFLGSFYFLASAAGVVWFFLNFKKLLK